MKEKEMSYDERMLLEKYRILTIRGKGRIMGRLEALEEIEENERAKKKRGNILVTNY